MAMTKKCTICGRSESQVIADAKALGLLEELQCGMYTCCQISEWADEQLLAWSNAAHENASYSDGPDNGTLADGSDAVLVPIRFHRPQVPWYRDPDKLNQ